MKQKITADRICSSRRLVNENKMSASLRCRIKLICNSVFASNKRHFSNGIQLQNYIQKSKTMSKILKKANRKKDKFNQPLYQSKVQETYGMQGAMRSNRQFSEGMKRRAAYLSEIFYEAVNRIIVCGEIEVTPTITKVEVLPDCSHMNVYWEASGIKEQDLETQKELDTKVKTLRHFLIQSHTIGNVPRPVFVADMNVARQRQVNELLRIVEPDIKALEDAIDMESSDNEDSDNISICDNGIQDNDDNQYRQDMYGVPHDAMMEKIVNLKITTSQRPDVILHGEGMTEFSPRINIKEAKKYFRNKKISDKKLKKLAEQEMFEWTPEPDVTLPDRGDVYIDYRSDGQFQEEDYSELDDFINSPDFDDERR